MIIDFTVENFGCIKEPQTISFKATEDESLEEVFISKPDGETRLLRMVTLLGYHGSGKTTMLEALNFCIATTFGHKDHLFLTDAITIMTINFIHEGIKCYYTAFINKTGFCNKSYSPNKEAMDGWLENKCRQIVNASDFLQDSEKSLGEYAYIETRELLGEVKQNSFVVTIDNFGIGLHADYYEELITGYLINNKDSLAQIIVATNNREFLKEELYRHDSIYFAEKINGQSEFYSLSDFKDINPNTFKRKIYEWAWMGKIGGKSYPSHLHCED